METRFRLMPVPDAGGDRVAFAPRQLDDSEPEILQHSHESSVSLQVAWLNEVAVSTEMVAAGDIFFGIGLRQDDDRNTPELFITLQDAKNLTAIPPRQIKVEEDESRMPGLRPASIPAQEINCFDAISGD